MSQETFTHTVLCIVCPEGCEMDIDVRDGELVFPQGICHRGQEYAAQEIYNPCRVLTTTVRINDGDPAMLPVRTSQPISKAALIDAMQQIADIELTAPVRIGDVICRDVAGTGVSLVACRTISINSYDHR